VADAKESVPANRPGDATSVLSPQQVFPKPEPRSAAGRRKADSRQPLEFAEHQQIGRFGLIREIARGGMGQVFLARDTKLGRKVAIKFLLHPDPNFVQRFLVEARATARCTHENIVTIFEVGEHDGLPFMVLEYLEGRTLSDLLDNGPRLSTRQFAELMVPVVRALERAHEFNIVHRDLKPSNIFITERGTVKVLDFGVAKCFDASDQLDAATATAVPRELGEGSDTYVTFSGGGTLVGTLPYMSPEQWGVDAVDHLSDIWAIGIMFWRALTKVHPAGTMAPDKLRERLCDLDTPLPSIASREPTLPRGIVNLIDRCLEKRKGMRYQSASELLVDLQAFLAPAAERVPQDVCPYRGLAAFGEGDAKYFFGRSGEIRSALSQLESWPLLAVIGPSGVGKSSFVHAGLVPAVRATGGDWKIRVLRPGRAPLHSLASVLEDAVDSGQVLAPVSEGIADQLRDAPGLFGDLLRKGAAKKRHRVLIVVDQLEELFTLSDDDAVRKTFLAALLAAADDPSAPVRVVLSMRADFLDRLAGHKQFLSELSRGLFFLSAPDLENLRETLVRPAELAGYAFEDSTIVDDMMELATSRGALPLLQFAATRLWDSRDKSKKKLTRAAYEAMGGVGGAFARHADEVAAAVAPQNQLLLRAILTRLVTPEGTRAVVDQKELADLSSDPAEVERILDQLVRARLIHLHTDPTQGATVEIVHEVLITEWPTLRRWLEEGQAARAFLHELRQAVRQWAARGKPSDLVWRGATAQEALGIANRHVLELSASEREYLDAVRSQVSRAKRRRVAAFGFVLGALAIVFTVGAVAFVRVSNANDIAAEKATAFEKAAAEARAAEAEVKRQLEVVRSAETKRTVAEAEAQRQSAAAQQASKQVELSKDELKKANEDLKGAFELSQKDKLKAQELAVAAKAAADAARKATDDAKAANASLQALLAKEQARVRELQNELQKIATGKLK
jgi:eukaryotic-like serine/threonine-protein kinase